MRSSKRQIKPLTPHEALDKLGSVSVGRAVYTCRGLPAIRFVNHILDDGQVVIRDHTAHIPALGNSEPGPGLMYQTDKTDPATGTGWSVTVTGPATLVEDPATAAWYRGVLRPWAAGDCDRIITISPHLVTGYEIAVGGEAT